MNPLLKPLVELQKIDKELAALEDSLKKYPEILNKLESDLKSVKSQNFNLEESLKSNKKKRMELELKLKSAEAETQKLSTQQMQVKTNKEYQAITHEIDAVNSRISGIEDEILMLIEKDEELQSQFARISDDIKQKEQEYNAEKSRIQALIDEKQRKMEGLKNDFHRIQQDVDPDLMDLFGRISHRHRGEVVVPVDEGTCGGCGITLTRQMISDVNLKQNEIICCERCSRIMIDDIEN